MYYLFKTIANAILVVTVKLLNPAKNKFTINKDVKAKINDKI